MWVQLVSPLGFDPPALMTLTFLTQKLGRSESNSAIKAKKGAKADKQLADVSVPHSQESKLTYTRSKHDRLLGE